VVKLGKLLETEMTRKQFVASLASAIIGLTGISAFLGAFSKSAQTPQSTNPGYGDRGYGP
jgi:NADH:ubiquinone oxidoreductase subunit 5 (subunit L)/multisubunit Na+/H+ antiporter MnhA subunit